MIIELQTTSYTIKYWSYCLKSILLFKNRTFIMLKNHNKKNRSRT